MMKKNNLYYIILIITLFTIISCSGIQLTEEDKKISILKCTDDNNEMIYDKCTPLGGIKYIDNPSIWKVDDALLRKEAVKIKANTVHFYYYDDVRHQFVVRFWRCP